MPYDFTTWDRNSTEEQATPIYGAVSGTLPQWLRGSFIINGPGRLTFGSQEYKHLFDGAALLQKFEFTETGAMYSSKFLRSATYEINSENQQIVISEFGTVGSGEIKKGLSKLKFSKEKPTDNASVNLTHYGKKIYANTEAPFVHEIDPKTLDTVATVDLAKEVGIVSQCPHTLHVNNGSTIAMFTSAGPTGPKYEIYNIPSGTGSPFSKEYKVSSLETRWKLHACHIHSFAATENYVFIPEQPFVIDIKSVLANTFVHKAFIDALEWKKDKQVKFRVINRKTGKELKLKFKTDIFYYVHVVNSYEENDHLVVDFCSFSSPDLLYLAYLKTLRNEMHKFNDLIDNGKISRYVIPLNSKEKTSPEENLITLSGSKAQANRQKDGTIFLKPETISNTCFENPTFNSEFTGKKYSYFYGASSDTSANAGKVGKVDLRSGKVTEWCKDDVYACVLSFVPRPGAKAEDDGVVVVVCLRGGAEKSKICLAILEAATMEELCFIDFQTPSDATRAFHGIYLPA